MRVSEFDWRYSWISRALVALDQGVAGVGDDIEDGLDCLEHAETFIGLGYVAIQAYINGVAEDLKWVFADCPKAPMLRNNESPIVNNTDVTHVESIWAAANYFKHHDEWGDWERDAHGDTLSVLKKLGISEKTEFPCVEVLRVLQGKRWELASLLDAARRWRESWFLRLQLGLP
jgi:hypothetical protein